MSLRLDAIVNMAPAVGTAADIGCDHGKAGAALLLSGKAQRVIFTDISAQSLEKTRKLVSLEALEERSSLRVGNGLEVLDTGEADAAVIAGMGGELITRILEEGKDRRPDKLVLSCNSKPEVLRRWLGSNGYEIEDEELVFEENRFYPVILAEKGETREMSEVELELGPILLKKKPELLIRLVSKKIENAVKNRDNIIVRGTPGAREKLGELSAKIEKYKDVKQWLRR